MNPLVTEMQHYANVLDFVDASLRLIDPDDEDLRENLQVLRDYAVSKMEAIWAVVEVELCAREVGAEKAALFERLGCNSLIKTFGYAYRAKQATAAKGTP